MIRHFVAAVCLTLPWSGLAADGDPTVVRTTIQRGVGGWVRW